MKYQSLRGMKDILPEETPVWQRIEEICRKNFQNFNYQEIRTPLLEKTELFARAVGGETDIVAKEMYSFIDKGDRNICLRPEGTASVVRAALEHNLIGPDKLTKLYYFGPMFRYERPQAGRYRQFHQVGIEAFGSADVALDVETILLAIKIFADLGLKDLEVDVNSVGCRECRPHFIKNLKNYLKDHVENMCEDCNKRFEKNPLRVLDCKKERCQKIIDGAPATIDSLCTPCRDHFEELEVWLEDLGVNFNVNKRLVRGLDYYTKTTYEIISKSLGAQNAVCGGGRYDNLVADFGGQPIPAVGFAIGIERLTDVLNDQLTINNDQLRILLYFAPIGEAAKKLAAGYLKEAREKGIAADMDYSGKKLKSQLKTADRIGAKYAVIIGEDEIKKEKVILRDMQKATQSEVSFDEALKVLP